MNKCLLFSQHVKTEILQFESHYQGIQIRAEMILLINSSCQSIRQREYLICSAA